MYSARKLLAVVSLGSLVLVGCSENTPETMQTPEPSTTASASPSPSKTATPTPKATPTHEATTPVEPEVTPEPVPADNGLTDSVGEHLNAGGPCNSDYFPAGPPTEQALKEIQVYCEVNSPVETDTTFTYDEAYEAWSSGRMTYYQAFCENYVPQTSGGVSQCVGIENGTVDSVTGEYLGELQLPPGFPPADGGDPYCNSDPVTGETACVTPGPR